MWGNIYDCIVLYQLRIFILTVEFITFCSYVINFKFSSSNRVPIPQNC